MNTFSLHVKATANLGDRLSVPSLYFNFEDNTICRVAQVGCFEPTAGWPRLPSSATGVAKPEEV